jgi:hypothetical protein
MQIRHLVDMLQQNKPFELKKKNKMCEVCCNSATHRVFWKPFWYNVCKSCINKALEQIEPGESK